ncbi:protein vreteno-like [Eurosta solidaginis]|uniref:protein vreteno-like n=1 Tax=Eurosta solidaginis TaxID=178769 RepID=UPI003530F4F9
MDRRALAQRNRKPQANNAGQDKSHHGVPTKKQNGYQSENRHNPFKSPVNSVVEAGNAGGATALQTGECVSCRSKAICVCQRCGDYYCSPQCQMKDWPSHRYICFPVPALVHPATTLTTDALYPVEKPLMTVNQLTNHPLDNRQTILNEIFNSNLLKNNQQQFSQNLQQQNFALNGQQQQQQQQRFGQNNNRGNLQQNANKNPNKNKEPTASIPLAVLPKNNSRVILTGFRTPNRCYVRPLSNEEDEDYLLNARKIDTYGKNAAPLSKVPRPHTYAIAPYEGAMYRVEILQAQERNPDNIRVLFLDRGILATRRLNQLREINDEIILLKQYACMVPLRNVSNYVLNGDMTKLFNTFEDKEFKIKYERVEDGVELFHWQTDKSLNDEIEQFCKESGAEVWADTMRKKQENNDKKANQAGSKKNTEEVKTAKNSKIEKTPEKAAAAVNGDEPDEQYYAKSATSTPSATEKVVEKVKEVERPTLIAPFETHYFKVGCAPFKSIVLDVSCLEIGYIGCIAQADLACLQTVHKQLSTIDVPNKPYVPKLDEYCIAKFEDMWYRAQVTDIPDDSHFTVMYIDFTNEATLTSNEIRHYPASVTGVCKTNLCLIDGLPSEFSAELIKFLNEEITLQTVITIDGVKKIDEQVVVIECKNLLSKIQQKNLLG